jgi:hypothetical protein
MEPKRKVKPWLPIKWAQPQPQPSGFDASEIEDAVDDPEEANQDNIENPAFAGAEIARLALLNQLLESNELKSKITKYTKGAIYEAAASLRRQIDPLTYSMVEQMGVVSSLQPHTLDNFYTELSKKKDGSDVSLMQDMTYTIIQTDAEHTAIKEKFQQVFDELWINSNQRRFVPGPIKFFASKEKKQKWAQAEQGPLLAPKYTSYDSLKNDLLMLLRHSPKVAQERILDAVGQDEQESAKEALSAFFQGYPEGLSTLYSLLIKAGKAEPIDTQMVETIMENRPELAKKDKPVKVAGLWLPPMEASMSTADGQKNVKEASGSVGGPGPHYYTHGPGDNKFCPKLRNMVNSFVCRYHCLDGLPVDDASILCGEAIWRQAVMDKYSREYRDKDGNWVGGYINKRFEVERDTGGHPYQLKPGKRSSPIHEDAWSTEKRLSEMRRDEGEKRNYSWTPGDPKGLYNHDPYEDMGTTKNPQFAEKKDDPIAKLASRDVPESPSMWDHPVEAKKGKPVNPWAVCHTTVDKDEDPDKYERCVMDVKEKHPIKKDKKSSTTWSIEKKAYPSPMDPKNTSPEAGRECQNCKWSGGSNTQTCPYCGGKMISRNKMDFQMKAKQLPAEDSMGPSMASARRSHGVYRYFSPDGKVGYGDTLKQAQQNATVEDIRPSTVKEEAEEVANIMQGQRPIWQGQKDEPTDTRETPMKAPTEEVQVEPGELPPEPPAEPHILGDEADLAYSREIFEKTPEEQKEFETYNQDSKVIGPDPSTRPIGR